MDLKLRNRLGELGQVPVPERSRFFGQILDFFSGAASGYYPVYPLPEPRPFGSPREPDAKHIICAEHSPFGLSQRGSEGGSEEIMVALSNGDSLPPGAKDQICSLNMWRNY